jgi:hypothetical protein
MSSDPSRLAPQSLGQRRPAGIRFRRASWRLGAEELVRAPKEGHKRRKGVEGEDELCVASRDAAGVGWGSCRWLDVAGAFCPGPAGYGDVGRGGMPFVCADRGGPPSPRLLPPPRLRRTRRRTGPGYTNPMVARYGGRSPRLRSLAGWGPRRLWTPLSARPAACTPCAFCGYRLEGFLPRWEPSPQTSGQRILEAVFVVAIPSSDDARGDAVPRISILFLQPGGQ